MFQEMIFHITGNKLIRIENYKNILDYKETEILVKGQSEHAKITGTNLKIQYFTRETMSITGNLEQILLCRTDGKAGRR